MLRLWFVKAFTLRRLGKSYLRSIMLCGGIALGVSIFLAALYAAQASLASLESGLGSIALKDALFLRSRAGAFDPCGIL